MFKNDKNNTLKMKQINIRVTEEERELLHNIATKFGYKSTSKYLLDVAKNPVVFYQPVDQFEEIGTHISKIGTNINQVARKVNTDDYVMQQDLKEIMKLLHQLRAFLRLIKEFRFFEKSNLKGLYKYGDH